MVRDLGCRVRRGVPIDCTVVLHRDHVVQRSKAAHSALSGPTRERLMDRNNCGERGLDEVGYVSYVNVRP
ncbi:hypothetical protein C8039_16935 [Halogeometricum sp. wsp3]|nr:hypothetical protein C8039_16935 [Halogeometricum sp. wsp3]